MKDYFVGTPVVQLHSDPRWLYRSMLGFAKSSKKSQQKQDNY